MTKPIDAARTYLRSGWVPVPNHHKAKRPQLKKWQKLSVSTPELLSHFNGAPQNVGLLLGGPSGDLVDIDLDCGEAIALGKLILPPTPMRHGRNSKPDSHYWYKCPQLRSATFKDPDGGMLVEIRSTGHQTLVPPSIHPSDEALAWTPPSSLTPSAVDASTLDGAVRRLAAAALVARRWKAGTMHELALSLGGFLAEGGYPKTEAESLVDSICQAADDTETSDRLRAIDDTYGRFERGECTKGESALAYLIGQEVVKRLRQWLSLKSSRHSGIASSNGALTLDQIKAEHLTHVASARRLAAAHGDEVRHSKGLGWMVWDGARWSADSKAAQRLAQGVGELVRGAVSSQGITDPRVVEAYYRHAREMENDGGIRAVLGQAQALTGIDANGIEWDSRPFILNCPNGMLDLRSGKVQPHDRSLYLTKLCPTKYDPTAVCPRWVKFIDEVCCGRPDLAAYLQWIAGYALTGDTSHDVFFIANGAGANGKSTFWSVLSHAMGSDYAMSLRADVLLQQRYSQHPTGLASLRGARLAVAQETGSERRLNEATIKQLTGGDMVQARFIAKDDFQFRPQAKFVFATNHLPIIRDTSPGMWRRIRVLPFDAHFSGAGCDPHLEDKLKQEAEGILAWAVQGILGSPSAEPTPPACVKNAVSEYGKAQDTVQMFIDECCTIDPVASVAKGDLYAHYARHTGHAPLGKREFGQRLKDLGYTDAKTNGNHVWRGLRLD